MKALLAAAITAALSFPALADRYEPFAAQLKQDNQRAHAVAGASSHGHFLCGPHLERSDGLSFEFVIPIAIDSAWKLSGQYVGNNYTSVITGQIGHDGNLALDILSYRQNGDVADKSRLTGINPTVLGHMVAPSSERLLRQCSLTIF